MLHDRAVNVSTFHMRDETTRLRGNCAIVLISCILRSCRNACSMQVTECILPYFKLIHDHALSADCLTKISDVQPSAVWAVILPVT